MRTLFFSITLLLILPVSAAAQQRNFNGTLRVIGPGSDNAAVYISELKIAVMPDNKTSVTLHFKGGSRTEKTDYIELTGTLPGTLSNNELNAKGWVNSELKDGKRLERSRNFVSFKGTLKQQQITGKAYVAEKPEETPAEAFFSFSASAGNEQKPDLVYPLGKSPKIFNKGWILGAKFILTDANGRPVDLSDKVKWSGSGSFSPSMGKEVKPSFSSAGSNKISLSVDYGGQTYQADYTVEVVNALDYARVGSISFCKADAHGCHACPHSVMGPVVNGNSRVLIAGLPAACVGDMGVHSACCGKNTFTITSGDPDVLINGKPVAKMGSKTRHCGGLGEIVKLSK